MGKEATKKTTKTLADDPRGVESQIRQRAFELYQERGQEDGHELEDWLLAQQEVTNQKSRIAA